MVENTITLKVCSNKKKKKKKKKKYLIGHDYKE